MGIGNLRPSVHNQWEENKDGQQTQLVKLVFFQNWSSFSCLTCFSLVLCLSKSQGIYGLDDVFQYVLATHPWKLRSVEKVTYFIYFNTLNAAFCYSVYAFTWVNGNCCGVKRKDYLKLLTKSTRCASCQTSKVDP